MATGESARDTLARMMESQGEDPADLTPGLGSDDVAETVSDDSVPYEADSAADTDDAAEAEEQPGSDTPRDEKGRFAPKSATPDNDKEPDAADDTAPVDAKPEDAPKDEDDHIEPLAHWKLEDQERFRSLKPEDQKWILDQHRAIDAEKTRVSQEAKQHGYLAEVFTPDRMDALTRDGVAPETYIKQLVSLSDYANRDPAGFLRYMAERRGLTPEQVFGTPAQQQVNDDEDDDFPPDPALLRAQQDAAEARRIAEEVNTRWQTEQTTAQWQAAAAAVAEFRDATDERGAPLHPYFEEVRGTMRAFMDGGQTDDIETAYQMAVRANPDTYAKMQAAERAAEARRVAAEQRKKAKEASRAGSSVAGTTAGPGVQPPPANARDHLARVAEQMGLS